MHVIYRDRRSCRDACLLFYAGVTREIDFQQTAVYGTEARCEPPGLLIIDET